MKSYSNSTVTKDDLNAIDATQTEAIKSLKFWVGMLACGTAINFVMLILLAYFSTY